ncbi:MAG TPA: single-stranded-DNA-specific exonuclease RecJ [Candidatus Paceibacterota bacterium]
MKRYQFPEQNIIDQTPEEIIVHLLKTRSIDPAKKHLDLTYDDLESPYVMGGVEKAVTRIIEAIDHKERIMIAGDYDCDGVCSTVTLLRFFRDINIEPDVAIPNRHTQGYGFHTRAVDEAIENGVSLIITVDVGIKEHATVAYAKEKGIDVIVTDHHEPADTLPDAYTIVNPKLGTGDTMICGAAVAWQLGRALYQTLRERGNTQLIEGCEKWFLDLVCIATLGDQVPLKNQNRILAQYGMRVLQKTKLIGLTSLLFYAKIKNISYSDISFTLVPLINSASRMDHAHVAINLFLAKNSDDADVLARKLVALNQARKLETAKVVRSTEKKKDVLLQKNIIVIGDKKWHLGVVGIIAGKLLDMFEVPVFVWSVDEEGVVRGSCRSHSRVSVIDIFEYTKQYLLTYGGHHQAGGFALDKKNLIPWIEAVESFPSQKVSEELTEEVDFLIAKKHHIQKLVEVIKAIEPCGQDFKLPFIGTIPFTIARTKSFGSDGSHYEVSLEGETETLRGVWFYGDENKIEIGKRVQAVGSAEFDSFRNEYVLFIRDIIPYDEA